MTHMQLAWRLILFTTLLLWLLLAQTVSLLSTSCWHNYSGATNILYTFGGHPVSVWWSWNSSFASIILGGGAGTRLFPLTQKRARPLLCQFEGAIGWWAY